MAQSLTFLTYTHTHLQAYTRTCTVHTLMYIYKHTHAPAYYTHKVQQGWNGYINDMNLDDEAVFYRAV